MNIDIDVVKILILIMIHHLYWFCCIFFLLIPFFFPPLSPHQIISAGMRTMRLMDATLASPAFGLVRVVSGGNRARWAVGTDPLPRDRPSVWSVQLHSLNERGYWIGAGITSSATPRQAHSYLEPGSYVWSSINNAYSNKNNDNNNFNDKSDDNNNH